ncbi:cordon-bleu protein-like 1 isoform X1 [Epinephelus moara]|uniref:cordon-bleu protein-like 1 isoform X1 n=1 Tax=Epinephelus moara TaxID=300413 RepID=UPI00214E2E13|nr:cordon-bleu protein-like 1 isoform X1 [Epinephelus moara]XP_049919646.1 cordon-bleu protein-like 1 isoform X1 [Epinephelus moara]XP_049919647.1 cordon-bleu protein-like 1 isoform X1 [Epinephelus moara]
MDEQVNPLERDHSLSVVLPGGMEKSATVHGSKPVMDLLVTLCASYHLNPSDYTVEVLSPNKNNINFKPNSPIGSLEAEKIVLKPRGVEEKIRKPYMPEASVRLLINYNKSHKAVVRVNPRVPLEVLLPVVCDKCEFQVETTVLLRDSQSKETLDLTKTLNDHGLREVFAKDTAGKEPTDHQHQPKTPEAAVTPTEVISPPPLQDLPKKEKKQKENTGFLSLFRRRKNNAEREGARSAPASPGLIKQGGVNNNEQGVSPSNTLPTDMPKKRRAPQPPMGASQSVPNNLGTCHIGGSQRSAESTLKRTKRRAPPPPCANGHQELQADTQVKGTVNSLNTVEELRESEESDYVNLPLSSSSSPHPSHPRSSSSRPSFAHLHEAAEPYLPSFRGKDLSEARCALAKILTSSVSKGTLVKRLSNSATFSKLHTGSSYMSATQRCSDNGVFCAELEPVITSNLPTENDWEDPVHRKGMTTFKVVPAKKPKSHDPEVTSDKIAVEDNPESEASPKVETEEDLCPPDRLEAETPPQSPEPSNQTSDRPAYLSPPLHHQDSPGSPLSEADEKQMEEDEPEDTTEVTAAAQPDCIDGELTSDVQINSEDQTEFQSLNGQSGRADVDHCGSYTDEEEVEEVVVQEEDDDVKDAEEVVVQEDDDDEKEAEEEVVQKEDDVKEEAEEEVVQKEDDVKEEAEEEVVQEEDDVKEEAEEEVVQEEENDEKEVEEEVVQEGDEDEECFPPPPPPVFFDTEVMEAEREQTTASSLPSSVPPSPTSNGQTNAFSEDHENEPTTATATDQSAAAPKPLDKMSAAPSRFAQAVALAVQRSQSRGKSLGPQAPGGPHSTLPSPPRSTYQYGA